VERGELVVLAVATCARVAARACVLVSVAAGVVADGRPPGVGCVFGVQRLWGRGRGRGRAGTRGEPMVLAVATCARVAAHACVLLSVAVPCAVVCGCCAAF
jgi:hypothetical protein